MRPLEGIPVVTLEHAIAAPFATRQLADLGARVIKIERPGVGDFARAYDERVRGLASHVVWTGIESPAGTIPAPLPPGSWSLGPPCMHAVPALGQHTEAILGRLGQTAAEIAALRRSGAI